MRSVSVRLVTAGLCLSFSAWAQSNACDLTGDGRVDASDVQASINMSLGSSTCTANIVGSGVCNIVLVQRVINASLGQACLTGSGRSVALTWVASTTPSVSYKVYRGTVSGGPYTFLSSAGTTTSFTDSNVQSGITYYYVVTAVDSSSNESVYSNQTQAVIP
jgi:hypothetical protein